MILFLDLQQSLLYNEKNLKSLDQVDLGFAVTEHIRRSRQVLSRDDKPQEAL